jgi:hypothetical protein
VGATRTCEEEGVARAQGDLCHPQAGEQGKGLRRGPPHLGAVAQQDAHLAPPQDRPILCSCSTSARRLAAAQQRQQTQKCTQFLTSRARVGGLRSKMEGGGGSNEPTTAREQLDPVTMATSWWVEGHSMRSGWAEDVKV